LGPVKPEWIEIKWCIAAFGEYVDVNILGGNVHTIKENAEALILASKESGLEVNTDKTKYMTMSRDQNAGRSHNMKIDNVPFEIAEPFKYSRTTVRNQNCV
jgi:hypothetical protein